MNKVNFTLLLLLFCFIACNTKEEIVLECQNGIEKITVEIEGGLNYLVYDKPTKTNFVVENIEPISLVVMGLGIKPLGTNGESKMQTEIKVPNGRLENDTLTVKVKYGEGYTKGCTFNIPVRKAN